MIWVGVWVFFNMIEFGHERKKGSGGISGVGWVCIDG